MDAGDRIVIGAAYTNNLADAGLHWHDPGNGDTSDPGTTDG